MTNPLNTNPLTYDQFDNRLTELFNLLPPTIALHIDYLPDDFHDDPAAYLSALPRFADLDLESLLYPTMPLSTDEYQSLDDAARTAYLAEFDALIRTNFDNLKITDTDLLALIAIELIDHTDCSTHD